MERIKEIKISIIISQLFIFFLIICVFFLNFIMILN